MSLSIRVVGNKARANPRQYSTHAEPAFAHRKAPPMPTFDHLLQPGREFVSFLSQRIHSMLGPAFMAHTAPEIATAPAPRPVMVETEIPTAYETALLLVNEQGKEWSWNETEHENKNALKLWSLQLPKFQALRSLISSTVSNSSLINIPQTALSYAFADVSLHQWNSDRQDESNNAHKLQYSAPRVALITVPSSYRSLDGPHNPEFVQASLGPSNEDVKTFLATAAVTTAFVAYSTVAAGTILGGML